MLLKRLSGNDSLEFYTIDDSSAMELPLYASGVSAGFPSPADDYVDVKLDLNKHLIQHPSATFYVKVKGNSMEDANIKDGDMLVVDRSLEARHKDVVVCILEGEFTVKRLIKEGQHIILQPENKAYQPIKVNPEMDFAIWGVVSYIIHKP